MRKDTQTQLSDEILDILGETPSWIVRTGASVIAGILILFFIGTWVIKYPEVLKGNALVTSKIPIIRVVAPAGGRMTRLLIKDETIVKKGDILAETENITKLENIPIMQNLIGDVHSFLNNSNRKIVFPGSNFVWGDLQDDFNLLRQSYIDYKRLQSDDYQDDQEENLTQQAISLRELAELNERQREINELEFQNSEERYKTDEKLFKDGVTSNNDYLKSKNKRLERQRDREDFQKELIDNKLKITKLERTLRDFDYLHLEKKRLSYDNIERSLYNIENKLRNWKQNYLITAPSDGKLVFLKNLTENQFLKPSDTLFAVIPLHTEYIASVDIPVKGMGKASLGQKVIIKLDDYPYQEFGMLEGKVVNMTPSINVRNYRVQVSLTNGLKSTYNQQFIVKSEMAGTAEIVTADLRLIERAFYGLRKLFM
jgi:multidrug efflux pump subunit AcrA (membrane-fusion protein)